MSEKFHATLIHPNGTRLDFVTSDLSQDVMFPDKRSGKLLYLSRICSVRQLEYRITPDRGMAVAVLAFTGRPFFAGLAALVNEKTTCLSEIQFYGDAETYLLLTNERITDKIEMILQDIRFYGSYKENLPGRIGRMFNIGNCYIDFFHVALSLLFLGMLCLTGFFLVVMIAWIVR